MKSNSSGKTGNSRYSPENKPVARMLYRFGDVEVLVSPATPVIATHIGRNAWGLAYMVED